MNDVEQELRRELADVGAVIEPAGPPVAHLVSAGRTARTRRRVVGGATVLAAAAVVVAMGAVTPPSARPVPPAVPVTPSVSPSVTMAPPGAIASWVNGLPVGEPRTSPADQREGNVVWKGRTYGLPSGRRHPGGPAYPLLEASRGLLTVWHSTGFTGAEDWDAQLGWLTGDGSWKPVATGFGRGQALDPEGNRYAYVVQTISHQGEANELVVRNLRTDAVLLSATVPDETLLGWTRTGLILERTGQQGGQQALVRDPDTAKAAPLATDVGILDLAPAGDRALVERLHSSDSEACNAYVASIDDLARPLRRGCAEALSPDGRYTVRGLTATDVDTGRTTRLAADAPEAGTGQVHWSGPGTVEIEVFTGPDEDGTVAVVRCRVPDGGCERAP